MRELLRKGIVAVEVIVSRLADTAIAEERRDQAPRQCHAGIVEELNDQQRREIEGERARLTAEITARCAAQDARVAKARAEKELRAAQAQARADERRVRDVRQEQGLEGWAARYREVSARVVEEERAAQAAADAEAAKRHEMPPPRLIKTPEDAEAIARDVLAALGFEGVRVTRAGPDGGVDVRGHTVVAQVKLEGVKTDVARVQALYGVAAYEGKQGAFFSLAGYTAAAVTWAQQARIALFEFDYSGSVVSRSTEAQN